MKVLITGATGLIGSNLIRTVPDGVKLYATYHINRLVPEADVNYVEADITDKKIGYIIEKIDPDVVIHTAAKGSPDWCEMNKKEAYKVNVKGTKYVADACKKIGAGIVFFSSNANFDGKNPPYYENSTPNPLSEYGRNKVEAENYIDKIGVRNLIIRTMSVYGWSNPYGRMNFLSVLLDKTNRGEKMSVTKDLYLNFIYVLDICGFVWDRVTDMIFWKTYHLAGAQRLTHWEFTKKAVEILGLNKKLLKPVKNKDLVGFIPRPKDTTFDCSQAVEECQFSPMTIEEGLKHFKDNTNFTWRLI